VAEPTTEEPWSGYRKLNAGLQKLTNFLEEGQAYDLPGNQAIVITEARALAADLTRQAQTVETAAMVRAMQFVMDTVIKDASARAIEGESVVYTVSLAKKDLQHLIDQVGR